MLYEGPGSEFTAIFYGFVSGLVGTAGVRIEDADGNVQVARVTTGIVESPDGSGIYLATLTAPSTHGVYQVIFDNGAASPTPGDFAVEELTVTVTGALNVSGVAPAEGDETLQDLRDLFYRELSDELQQVCPPDRVEGWLNDGRPHLGFYEGKTATLTWAADDYLVDLPSDFCEFDSIVAAENSDMPAYRVWNRKLRLEEAATSAGSATLFYAAVPAQITGSAPSTLPRNLNRALVAFALYRFLKWLVASRADYRRYSTIAQGNAADIPTLMSIAAGYRQDFIDALGTQKLDAPVTFFGD